VRRVGLVLVLALVATACTSTPADPITTFGSSTTTTEVAQTTSTTDAYTSTTVEVAPLSTATTATRTTTSSATTATLDLIQDLLKSIAPVGGSARYNSNQYGCHSDGRCLDDWDVWCDEGEWGWSDEAASELCSETAEDYGWSFDG